MVSLFDKASKEEEQALHVNEKESADLPKKDRRNLHLLVSLSLVLILFLSAKLFLSFPSSPTSRSTKEIGRDKTKSRSANALKSTAKNMIQATNTTFPRPHGSEGNATIVQEQERALQGFQSTQVTFYVTGDAPYDQNQARRLEAYMERVPQNGAFLAHVGDMRYAGNYDICNRFNEYAGVRRIMLKSRVPVFMLVGDNDIADCPNPDEGQRRWSRNLDRLWEQYRFPQQVQILEGIPGTWTFTLSNILYIGLHVTDARNNFARRQANWARNLIGSYKRQLRPRIGRVVIFHHSGPYEGYNHAHQILFDYLSESFGNDPLPILFIQGDWHYWAVERNFYGNPSWMRIVVEGEANEAPTKMTIRSNGDYQEPIQAFHFERRRS